MSVPMFEVPGSRLEEMRERIAELERENAKLRAELNDLQCERIGLRAVASCARDAHRSYSTTFDVADWCEKADALADALRALDGGEE